MTVMPDTAYFASAGPTASPAGSNELYSVDLFTGEHELIGSFSPTITGVGIAGVAVPEPSTVGLLAAGCLALVFGIRRLRIRRVYVQA